MNTRLLRSRTARRLAAPACLLAASLAVGCGSDATDIGLPDVFDDEEPSWPGVYAAEGVWNLSGPFSGGRTVGDAVAEMLVDRILGTISPPSAVEDKVAEFLASRVYEPVKSVVDGAAPAELGPSGVITEALRESLADVRVTSTIMLKTDGLIFKSVAGVETIEGLVYFADGEEVYVDTTALNGATVEAVWEGDEDDGVLEIEPHGVAIQFGALVQHAAERLGETDELQALRDDVLSSIDCARVVSGILGGDTAIEIGVSEWSYSVEADELARACDGARGLVKARVLGLFKLDTGVVVGGSVGVGAADADGKAVSLTSKPGFGGFVDLVPEPLAPRVSVSFTATRGYAL